MRKDILYDGLREKFIVKSLKTLSDVQRLGIAVSAIGKHVAKLWG